MLWYPNISGIPVPTPLAQVHLITLPTYNYSFQFGVNQDPPGGGLDMIGALMRSTADVATTTLKWLSAPGGTDVEQAYRFLNALGLSLFLEVVGVALEDLDVDALVEILKEPKNALVKQYQKLFELDGVELEFTQDAVDAVADLAMVRGTGARGLRAIIEEVLLHVMYDVPSREDVAKVVVTGEVVSDNVNPTLVPRDEEPKKRKSA